MNNVRDKYRRKKGEKRRRVRGKDMVHYIQRIKLGRGWGGGGGRMKRERERKTRRGLLIG